jgi:hypothetical protein
MTEPDTNAFAKYIPGFEFLQNLTRQAAAGTAPGTQSSVPGMPPLSHWVAPTFDVEELDKRIQDLRAVHFWLDQNTKALAATIQALEVQKMTLATLKSMNVSMQDMADAFKVKTPEEKPAPEAKPSPSGVADSAQSEAAVDPLQWWSALTQQFQTIANDAIKDMADHATRTAEQVVAATQAAQESSVASKKPAAAAKRAPRKSSAAAGKASRPAASATQTAKRKPKPSSR